MWQRVDESSQKREWVWRESDEWEVAWREGREREFRAYALVMRITYKTIQAIRCKWWEEWDSRIERQKMLREDGSEIEREKGESEERVRRRELKECEEEKMEREYVATWVVWERAELLMWDVRETERRDIELMRRFERVAREMERV